MKLTDLEAKVYSSMLENCEYDLGEGWAQIYLDNARPADMSARQFAAILSSLKQKGLYESQGDNFFGLVLKGVVA